MSRQKNEGDQVWDIVTGLFFIFMAILFGLFIISRWLTAWLFSYVVNPMTDGLLDRNDGLVVSSAALLWGVVAAVVIAPWSISRGVLDGTTVDVTSYWFGVTVGGVLWGIAIGVWILNIWWNEAQSGYTAGYDVVQLLDTPIEIRQPGPLPASGGSRPVDVDTDELERLILGNDVHL